MSLIVQVFIDALDDVCMHSKTGSKRHCQACLEGTIKLACASTYDDIADMLRRYAGVLVPAAEGDPGVSYAAHLVEEIEAIVRERSRRALVNEYEF